MGTLFLVGTPIGNLKDITLRALETLKECDLLVCEDTRVTKKLLNHFGIRRPTKSFHKASSSRVVAQVARALRMGKKVGYVTDAGMPGLSDPGARLVSMCMEKQLPFDVIPGPSALTTALAAMPLEAREFTFFAFPPSRKREQRRLLRRISQLEHPAVLFVAPHDLRKLLSLACEVLPGEETQVLFCRELTKAHQEIRLCPLKELSASLPVRVRGEVALVFIPTRKESREGEPEAATLENALRALSDRGFSRRDTLKILRAIFPGQSSRIRARLYNRERT